MRKWAIPATILGLGGIGAVLFSKVGRKSSAEVVLPLSGEENHFASWNDAAQRELERIQATLDEIAESLQPKAVR